MSDDDRAVSAIILDDLMGVAPTPEHRQRVRDWWDRVNPAADEPIVIESES